MHFNAHLLFLPALFAMSSVLAQPAAEGTSGYPDVAYPSYGDAFVFCSAADCTGTCAIIDGEYLGAIQDEGEYGPNDMTFQSVYWYDPESAPWVFTVCPDPYNPGCDGSPTIGPNTCYNLYYDGALFGYDYYGYTLTPGWGAP